MKKILSVLLIFIFSLFTISSSQASSAPAAKAPVTKNAIAKAAFGGHWEIWCVYNEKTGEFELICVWVEDDNDM